ncbi:cytosine permease [Psychrosphaera sp. 1_MG-2023]|nr:cytosine permease [Psychrosphaera sp. 1_MG-2023]MDO6718741.1 cytosine permease [Psychrosphaera sp. 1_MG-2023]
MAKHDDVIQNYTTTPVPLNKTVGGVGIGMINGNLAFAVPGLITGLEIGTSLGFKDSLMAFILGGLILSILGYVTGLVGRYNRLTSYMTMKFVFGIKGANLISFAFVLSLLGWYGVNIDLFSEVSLALLQQEFDLSPPVWLLEICLGIIITITTIWGFTLLEKVSNLFVPILALILVFMLYQTLTWQGPTSTSTFIPYELSFGEAVSAVVGSFIVSVVLMPDFTRFAKTNKDTAISSFLPFLGLSSFVYIVSAMSGILLMESDVLNVMLTLGLGLFAFTLLIISSWVTNVVNLYSIGLGLSSVFTKIAERKLVVIAGLFGTAASTLNLLDSFTDFLFSLAIIFTPVAAIYVVDFFIINQKRIYKIEKLSDIKDFNVSAITAWMFGVVATYLSNQSGISFSGVEAIDAFVISAGVYWFLCQFNHQTN